MAWSLLIEGQGSGCVDPPGWHLRTHFPTFPAHPIRGNHASAAKDRLPTESQTPAAGSCRVQSALASTAKEPGCGQGPGSTHCRAGGSYPPTCTPSEDQSAEFLLWFQRHLGYRGEDTRLRLSRRGRRLLHLRPRLPAHSSKSHGAMWLLLVPCILPPRRPEGKWWAGGWSIIRANTVSGEASLPLTVALGDTGHGRQGEGWCCRSRPGHLPADARTWHTGLGP